MTSELRHHLPEQVLLAYSAGTLPEAFSLVVACHISMCDTCRATLEGFDAIGGGLLESGETMEIDEDALARTMALISQFDADVAEAPEKPVRSADPVLPAPLQDYVGGGVDAIRWRSTGGGAKQCILPVGDKEGSVRLLYIPAGAAMPDHGHRGLELTLVLQGAFADEVDRFGRGDVEIGHEDLNHRPVAEPGMDCICLAATDAPLKFSGLLPRLAQPFLRI